MLKTPKLRFKDKNGNTYPEWEEILLGDIGELRNGIAKGSEFFGHGHKFINLQDVFGKDCLYNDDYDLVETSEKERQLNDLKKGDVIFVRSSVKPSGVGLPSVVMEDLKDTVFSGFLIRFREHKLCLNLLYKRYCFIVDSFRREVLKRSSSSANTNINQDNLANIKLKIPCLEEQEKIAGFLSKVDELINECEGEVKDLEEQKKGLMQKIFSQQIRFKDSNNNFYPDWEEKVMNDILNEYCKKNSISNQYPVLTSSKQGLMLQTEYYSGENRITEKDNIGFNIIPPNYITYRSRSDDGLFTFNINNLGVTGIVSTYYPVFSTNYNNLFVMTYLNINKNNLFKYAVGSSQKVLSLNELKKVKIKLPCLEEQEKIAKVLSKMDELIEEKKALFSDWQQFKKGLLQQMFI